MAAKVMKPGGKLKMPKAKGSDMGSVKQPKQPKKMGNPGQGKFTADKSTAAMIPTKGSKGIKPTAKDKSTAKMSKGLPGAEHYEGKKGYKSSAKGKQKKI